MAISSDKQMTSDTESRASPIPYGRPGTTSPTPRLPGYIPGMPRPMTPRNLSQDLDEQIRSHSTTPRATSPFLPKLNGYSSPIPTSGSTRRDSNAQSSRFSPRPTSPSSESHFSLSGTNGSYLSDTLRNGEGFSIDFDSAIDASILGRRRPASPLSGSTYQPMAVSPRPGTPSTVTWNVQQNSSAVNTQTSNTGSASAHKRQASWVSDNSIAAGIPSAFGPSKSNARSLRSPALPDSPLLERAISPAWNASTHPHSADKSPSSDRVPAESIAPLFTHRVPRSPTPTQNSPQTPVSGSFSIYDLSPANSPRSSKQTVPSTPFSIGSFHPIVFSPLANSSRSSLESAGSSYHSSEGERKDCTFNFFNDNGTPQAIWHDVSTTDKSSSATPGDDGDVELTIGQYAGLTKADFLAIQEKLVNVANTTPDVRERAPSLRRRRPSTSQSNYSVDGRGGKVRGFIHLPLCQVSSVLSI